VLEFRIVANDSYKQALDVARSDINHLLREREKIDKEIVNLENAINSLERLCKESAVEPSSSLNSEASEVSLRDAIRLVFNMARPNSLSPTEVRNKLRENGFHLDRYKYELPPIHNTIARLEAAGELEPDPRPDGEKAYKFVSSFHRFLQQSEFVGHARTMDAKPRHGRTGRDYNFKNRRAE